MLEQGGRTSPRLRANSQRCDRHHPLDAPTHRIVYPWCLWQFSRRASMTVRFPRIALKPRRGVGVSSF